MHGELAPQKGRTRRRSARLCEDAILRGVPACSHVLGRIPRRHLGGFPRSDLAAIYRGSADSLPRTRSIGGSSNPSFTPLDSAAARVRFNAPSAGEYRIAVGDASGVSVAIGDAHLVVYPYAIEVTTVAPPERPQSLMATASNGKVVLTWKAPANLGGAPLARYEYRHAAGTSVPSGTAWVSAGKALRATVRGLVDGTAYAFQVRAVNVVAGAGAAATARATPMAGICLAPDLTGRTQIWTAELTIATSGSSIGFVGYRDPPVGALSDTDFEHDGVSYTINQITDTTVTDRLRLGLERPPVIADGTFDDLTFHVCDEPLEFSNAVPAAGATQTTYQWNSTGLDWSSLTTRTLYISVPGVTSMGQEEDSTPAAQVTETADCPSTVPTCTFDIGETVDGALDPASDIDSWLVDLEEGKTYQFDVEGRDGGDGALPDPYVYLYPPTGGNEVASDTGTSAEFTYAVQTGDGGTYTLDVESNSGVTGDYRIAVTDITPMGQQSLRQEAPQPATPLTAEFRKAPAEHDGSSTFDLELHFSEAPKGLSYRTLRGESFFNVTNGTVTKAKRLVKKDNSGWRVTVEPDSDTDVSIGILPALPTADCAEAAVVCTADGTRLSVGAATIIAGPAALSVADTSVREAPGAMLNFVVTMNRARHEATTVDYATSDGTASAPDDYAHTAGTLTFDAGESEKTVSVPVVDDGHDDDGETVTFTLSNASAPTRITDDTAIGTIENSDPMPKAWLVRFGRTVGSQVVDALSDRFASSGRSHVTVGGIELRSGTMAEDGINDVQESLTLAGWEDEAEGMGPERTMTLDELVTGTRFHLSSGAPDGGGTAYTAWGRVATSGFEAEVDDVAMDGDVTSALVGFDAEWDRALAGVMLSQSSGEGSYRLNPAMGNDAGTVKSSLTGVYPYARLTLNPKLSAWALAGMGSGELTLRQNGKDEMPTDIEMRMGALGVNAAVLDAADTGGLALSIKSDAMWVSTKSDATEELRSSKGDVTRLRVAVHGERPFILSGERTLTPSAEIGLRHDAGDAETGAGLELGAGLRYSAGALTMEGRVRTLVAHADSGYEEWGASGSIQVAPGTGGRGLTLRIAPAWGATGSASERLWGARDAGELGARATEFEAQGRVESEIGYGIGVPGTRGVVTPYAGLSLAEGSSRTVRAGTRWNVAPGAVLGLEATRQESTHGAAGTNAIAFRTELRW